MTSISFRNAPAGTIRAALRYSAFRRLLSALAVSQIGDWLYNLALVVWYDRTHSPLWAGVTTAARVVPIVVPGPLGGVVADRSDRPRSGDRRHGPPPRSPRTCRASPRSRRLAGLTGMGALLVEILTSSPA